MYKILLIIKFLADIKLKNIIGLCKLKKDFRDKINF